MRDDTLKASVQYGDLSGTSAADYHDQRNLGDLAKKYGIDSDRYFVFGVELYIGETRRDTLSKAYVSLLAVDVDAAPVYGVDAVQRWVDDHDGLLPCVKFRVDATLEEVLLSFKRFDVVLTNSYIKRVNEYRFTEGEP